MIVELIGKPKFEFLPERLGCARGDQLQGNDAEKIVETAGRTCYDSFGKGRNSEEYAQHILDVGHGSVLEHAQYTFFISGVSRGLSHELVRHRIGVAISQRSTRYVDETETPWIMHPLVRELLPNEFLNARIRTQIIQMQQLYFDVVELLQTRLKERGVDSLTARKQARGAARGFLGNALMTELTWSANVRALRNMLEQRAHPAADAEIRELAFRIWEIMRDELPAYFSDYTPVDCPDGLGQGLETNYRKV